MLKAVEGAPFNKFGGPKGPVTYLEREEKREEKRVVERLKTGLPSPAVTRIQGGSLQPSTFSFESNLRMSLQQLCNTRRCQPCQACGGLLIAWRHRDGRYEPIGLDGTLHACPPRARRRWGRSQWERTEKQWQRAT